MGKVSCFKLLGFYFLLFQDGKCSHREKRFIRCRHGIETRKNFLSLVRHRKSLQLKNNIFVIMKVTSGKKGMKDEVETSYMRMY